MYKQFFNLTRAPFSIAPDPHFLFMSERHREALAHLLYGIDSGGGFVLLTGEIGAGKTTVCRCFLGQIPAGCNVAYIFNPKLTVTELLQSVCDEFHVDCAPSPAHPDSVKYYVDRLNQHLLTTHAQGQRNVLIIDEAQSLSADVLEQLRLLTNLETNECKLLQIILIGQPNLQKLLRHPHLEQLAQRVIARYHLSALSATETARYVHHRLVVAGLTSASPFGRRALRQVHQLTHGVPRRINLLCDRALLGAYAEGKHIVDPAIVKKAALEVFGRTLPPPMISNMAAQPARLFESIKAAPRLPNSTWRLAASSVLAAAMIAGAAAWAFSIANRNTPLAANASTNLVLTSTHKLPPQPKKSAAVLKTSASIDLATPANQSARDLALAHQQLAQRWNRQLTVAGERCDVARANELHCYRGSGGLVELRRLNRPAILTLYDKQQQAYYALLISLSNVEAQLQPIGAAAPSKVELAALQRHFRGEFVTYWMAPNNFRDKLALGDWGPDVDWLAQRLDVRNAANAAQFDQKMAKSVIAFQTKYGLPADGVADLPTLLQLNLASGSQEPQLQIAPLAASTPTRLATK